MVAIDPCCVPTLSASLTSACVGRVEKSRRAGRAFKPGRETRQKRCVMPSMLVEEVFPEVIGDKGTLAERLTAEGESRGLPKEQIDLVLSIIPPRLMQSGAFLDRMT